MKEPSASSSSSSSSSGQFGIRDSVATVLKNPMVKGILKNIVNNVLDAHGIPIVNSLPGTSPKDLQNIIANIVTNPTFAQAVADTNTHFSGVAPDLVPK